MANIRAGKHRGYHLSPDRIWGFAWLRPRFSMALSKSTVTHQADVSGMGRMATRARRYGFSLSVLGWTWATYLDHGTPKHYPMSAAR